MTNARWRRTFVTQARIFRGIEAIVEAYEGPHSISMIHFLIDLFFWVAFAKFSIEYVQDKYT